MTTRRAWLVALGAGALASAGAAFAQSKQPVKPYRIGMLFSSTPAATSHFNEAFKQGMREHGYVEGQHFILEHRYGEAGAERISEAAAELVRGKVDVIVAAIDPGIAAVKQQTRSIPIVMVNSSDPVGFGFVASLAHPGGNVTGLSNIHPELSGKRLELLREVVPGLSRVVIIWNPRVRGVALDHQHTESAARSLGLQLQSVELSRAEDFEQAFSTVTKGRPQALILPPGNPVLFANRDQITSFARRNRLPCIFGQVEFVDAGGLMSYGPSTPELFRRAAAFVEKILKGAKPADLPVEQPTKFELVINMKTAKALGITIPQSVLLRADRVIE